MQYKIIQFSFSLIIAPKSEIAKRKRPDSPAARIVGACAARCRFLVARIGA